MSKKDLNKKVDDLNKKVDSRASPSGIRVLLTLLA
jgi:hypothetical protein